MNVLVIGIIITSWIGGFGVTSMARFAKSSPCISNSWTYFYWTEILGTTALSVHGASRVLKADNDSLKLSLGPAYAGGNIALPAASIGLNEALCWDWAYPVGETKNLNKFLYYREDTRPHF